MKPNPVIAAMLFLALTQAGCGTQIGLTGSAYEEYQKSIKPYITYWTKEGMTEDGRLRDWVACGGQENGNFSLDRKKRLQGESSDTFRTRLEHDFERCMLRSGYRYTGDCSSERMKSQPLCGAP
ncbi:putative transmembrane protein [Sterolibacterium denitrificans]|uniref:Transmembrane protein n=1 Tax=Sterolibacterium denitrificans TaxID=157592 RepID=A0A7Z7MU38_9PROT|nr:hypothetical protein [Sterolibacterium denitrificans]SMB21535.1 putative transmembrane protein [Sterolibacterium denitrificans]